MGIDIEREDETEGRFIEAVAEYASTCDGCGELTMHEAMTMNVKTQLGYCEQYMSYLALRGRRERENNNTKENELCQRNHNSSAVTFYQITVASTRDSESSTIFIRRVA